MRDPRLVLRILIALAVASTGALLASSPPALAVAPNVAGTPEWGWVVARKPSTTDYTPAAKDQRNSEGGTSAVHRSGLGQYVVTLAGIGTPGGMVHVTPLATSARICVADWWDADASDELVAVLCYSRAGAPADSRFVVSFLADYGILDDLAYVWADQPMNPDYTPNPNYQFNSAGGSNTVHRLGTGRWQVALPGVGGSSGRGNVQVTAYGIVVAICRVVGWAAGLSVTVACRDAQGTLVNPQFDLTFSRGRSLKFAGDPNQAYVLADQPTTASYSSTAGYRFSSAGLLPVITRSGVGAYSVKLPGMPLGGGAQVSAYGSGGRRCVVSSIRKTDLPQRIGVRCFTPDGIAPADARFTLAYAK